MTNLVLWIGTTEIILIVVVVLLLFGGKKIPELMRGIGQGVQGFKKGMKDPIDMTGDDSAEKVKTEEPKKTDE